MKLTDIFPAALGIIVGLLLFFGYTGLIDRHLETLDAQRGVTEADYGMDR